MTAVVKQYQPQRTLVLEPPETPDVFGSIAEMLTKDRTASESQIAHPNFAAANRAAGEEHKRHPVFTKGDNSNPSSPMDWTPTGPAKIIPQDERVIKYNLRGRLRRKKAVSFAENPVTEVREIEKWDCRSDDMAVLMDRIKNNVQVETSGPCGNCAKCQVRGKRKREAKDDDRQDGGCKKVATAAGKPDDK